MDRKRERVEVKEETKLEDLCVKDKHTTAPQGFSKSLKACLSGMCVGDLKGKDEAGWEAFVKQEGGQSGLVPAWLLANGLGQYLKKSTKKAKDSEEAPAIPDVSQEVLLVWSRALEVLPGIAALRAAVNTPLSRPLPAPVGSLLNVKDPPEADVAQESAIGQLRDWALNRVLCSIMDLKRDGPSEDDLHFVYDSLIKQVLVRLNDASGAGLTFARNVTDKSGTTTAKSRPDFLCWLASQILGCKGEEKAEARELDVAIEELSSKLAGWSPTFFGPLPYQLAYAAGGNRIQFFAMDLFQNGKLTPVSDVIDLSSPKGRSVCVRIVVNIFQVLRAMNNVHPHHGLSLGRIEELKDGFGTIRTVAIQANYVEKHVTRAEAFTGPVLGELYAALKAKPIFHLARPTELPMVSDTLIKVKLEPVGLFLRTQPPPDQMKDAARSVLTALSGLHEIGWVHRDVRPSNIMHVPQSGWYLMDLEWAQKVDQPLGNYNPKSENTPPEMLIPGALWSRAADMWQFGRVLKEWTVTDLQAGALCASLLLDNPNDRLTAAQARHHAWFQNH